MKKKLAAAAVSLVLIAVPVAAHADDETVGVDIDAVVDLPLVDEILADTADAAWGSDGLVVDADDTVIVVPDDLDDPITVAPDGGTDFSIELPGDAYAAQAVPDPATASVVHALIDGSTLVPLVRDDATLQILSVVNDSDAPHEFAYTFDSEGGATVRLRADGGAEIVAASGDTIADVEVPWAFDAEGSPVATHFEAHGDTLVQRIVVDDPASVVYPIVADPALTVTKYEYKYTNVKRTPSWTNRSIQYGICKIERGAGGGTCTISASYKTSTEVSVSFSLTKAVVAAGIGIKAERTVSGKVSWTSPKAPVGASYKAWATGTRLTYNIQKWKVSKAGGRTARSLVSTSATLVAFAPEVGFAVGQ